MGQLSLSIGFLDSMIRFSNAHGGHSIHYYSGAERTPGSHFWAWFQGSKLGFLGLGPIRVH